MQRILNNEHTPKSLLIIVLALMGALDVLQLLMIRVADFWHFAHTWWLGL